MFNSCMRICFSFFIGCSVFSLTGCGESKPAVVIDSSNQDAIQEYEAMIAAEEKAANEGMAASSGQ